MSTSIKNTASQKPNARLENWELFWSGLRGNVYSHPNFKDGTLIVTSHLVNFDMAQNFAETKNTLYTLGQKAKEGQLLEDYEGPIGEGLI